MYKNIIVLDQYHTNDSSGLNLTLGLSVGPGGSCSWSGVAVADHGLHLVQGVVESCGQLLAAPESLKQVKPKRWIINVKTNEGCFSSHLKVLFFLVSSM